MEDTKTVSLLNRGLRHFDVARGGKSFRHSPGKIESYTSEEAEFLGGYTDLTDITKIPGQVDSRALKAENEKLQAEKKALEAQLSALQPKAEKPENPKSKKGW